MAKVEEKDLNQYPYTVEVLIKGMNCEHCEQTVEEEIAEIGDCIVDADAESGKTFIWSKVPVDLEKVEAAVEEVGFEYCGELNAD